MNWKDDATTYTTAAGHKGNILNTFLEAHADEMAWVEEQIDAQLSGYDTYNGVQFSMSGYVTSPSFTIAGDHTGTKLYCVAAKTSIDIDNPDWDSVIEEFVTKWQDFEENNGAENWNKFYEEGERYGWD